MVIAYQGKGRTGTFITRDLSEIASIYGALGDVPGIEMGRGALTMPPDVSLLEIAAHRGAHFAVSDKVREIIFSNLAKREELYATMSVADVTLLHDSSSAMRQYQRTGAFRLAKYDTLLCDDMGLGKTAQAIAGIEVSREDRNILIVCPLSVKNNWRSEIAKWSMWERPVLVVEAAKRQTQFEQFTHGWVIANYDLVRRDPWFRGRTWDWLVVDEAHNLKNRDTVTFKAIKKLKRTRTLLITGTPYGNDPSEVWTLLNLLDPQRFTSFWRFYECFVDYKEDWYSGTKKPVQVKNAQALRALLGEYMIRRTKAEVGIQLPPKTYQTLELEMLPDQKKHYASMARSMYVELSNGDRMSTWQPITQILRLRQILATPANIGLPDTSCKLDAVMDIILGTEQRVVVFSTFKRTLNALAIRLEKEEIPYGRITGDEDGEARTNAQDGLNEGRIRVVLSTLGAGGVGLNLQGASVLIMVDQHYNPIVNMQAHDRIHRIGQVNPVTIITLHCPETVDAIVQGILDKKIAMIDAVLAESLMKELEKYAR